MGINWHDDIRPKGADAENPKAWLRYRTRVEFSRWMEQNHLSDIEVSDLLGISLFKIRNVLHQSSNMRNFGVTEFAQMHRVLSSLETKKNYPGLTALNIHFIIFDEKEHPLEVTLREVLRRKD